MEKFSTRILVSGLNWSGASDVVDLLREYKDIEILGEGLPHIHSVGYMMYGEFNYVRETGGIEDIIAENGFGQKKYVEKLKRNYVRKRRKLLPKSIEKAIKLISRGKIAEVPYLISQALKLNKTYNSYSCLLDKLVETDNYQNKLELARKWLQRVFEIHFSSSPKAVVLDQPVTIGKNNRVWTEMFSPYKMILVYRDPRDQFA